LLIQTVQNCHLLSILEFTNIIQSRLNHPLQGFGAESLTFKNLDELLGKNWLGQTLLNVCFDLLSHELNRTLLSLIWFLPCHFHLKLQNSFNLRQPSPMLITVQEEMMIDLPFLVAFLLKKNQNHWAPTVTALKICTVLQGDSGGHPDDPQL
jgi:hypothetical protein